MAASPRLSASSPKEGAKEGGDAQTPSRVVERWAPEQYEKKLSVEEEYIYHTIFNVASGKKKKGEKQL